MKTTFQRVVALALCIFCVSLISPMKAHGEIILDYTHDLAGGNFFGTNATAKAALEAAVSDINSVLNLNLSAITTDTSVGTSGTTAIPTTATFDFDYEYTNPATGGTETITNTTLAANEIRVFVGAVISWERH